jgi:hypothetical protein
MKNDFFQFICGHFFRRTNTHFKKYEEFGGLKNALMNNKYTFTHDLHKLLLIKDKVLIFRKEINEVLNIDRKGPDKIIISARL